MKYFATIHMYCMPFKSKIQNKIMHQSLFPALLPFDLLCAHIMIKEQKCTLNELKTIYNLYIGYIRPFMFNLISDALIAIVLADSFFF